MATCTTLQPAARQYTTFTVLQTTLRVPHSNRLHVNFYYVYQPPNGSTYASAVPGLASPKRPSVLALFSVLSHFIRFSLSRTITLVILLAARHVVYLRRRYKARASPVLGHAPVSLGRVPSRSLPRLPRDDLTMSSIRRLCGCPSRPRPPGHSHSRSSAGCAGMGLSAEGCKAREGGGGGGGEAEEGVFGVGS